MRIYGSLWFLTSVNHCLWNSGEKWTSVVPYCLKKHSRLKYKKWPLGMAVAWQHCISLCSSWQAVWRLCIFFFLWLVYSLPRRSLGGLGVAVLEGRGNLRSVWISYDRSGNDAKTWSNRAEMSISLRLIHNHFRRLSVVAESARRFCAMNSLTCLVDSQIWTLVHHVNACHCQVCYRPFLSWFKFFFPLCHVPTELELYSYTLPLLRTSIVMVCRCLSFGL